MNRKEVETLLSQYKTRQEMEDAVTQNIEENIRDYVLQDLMSYPVYVNAR